MSKKTEHLSFVCPADTLRKAIDATSKNYIIIMPETNFLVLSNSDKKDNQLVYTFITPDAFQSFKVDREFESETLIGDKSSWVNLPTYAVEVDEINPVISSVRGDIKLEVFSKGDSPPLMFLGSAEDGDSSHEARINFMDERRMEEELNIKVHRRRMRFGSSFQQTEDGIDFVPHQLGGLHSLPLALVTHPERPYALFKFQEKFSPMKPKGNKNETKLWIEKSVVYVETKSSTKNVYTSDYSLQEIINTGVEDEQMVYITDPAFLEDSIKLHHQIDYIYLTDLSKMGKDQPLITFGSRRELGQGSIFTTSTIKTGATSE